MHARVGGFGIGGAFEGVALLSSQAFATVRALFFFGADRHVAPLL